MSPFFTDRGPAPRCRTLLVAAALVAVPAAAAQGGRMFDRVVAVLGKNFHDRAFRRDALPALAARYRAAAVAAASLEEERVVVHALLREIPASHLALYSKATYDHLLGEVFAAERPTFGFQLVQRGGRFRATAVLDGGPASTAGLGRGDRILALDGVFPGRSKLLDWRSDDAFLPDPPVHDVLVPRRGKVALRVERGGEQRVLELEARRWSGARASRRSVHIFDRAGRRLGYLHLWYLFAGSSRLVRRTLAGALAGCDGIVLDLRGRGGDAVEAMAVVHLLARHDHDGGCPVAVLIDRGTRSAKEIIASELRRRGAATLVGERTAGAALPATFAKVGPESVLMYPSSTLDRFTRDLELAGVAPDLAVGDTAGAGAGDAILDRALRLLAGR